MIPCALFEDEHLLVVNKPAGVNTHAPSPFAGEGIYDWLRNREPRWATLSIIHRLDKETSGVMVFGKTRLANQGLTSQFTTRTVRKRYALLTDRDPPRKQSTIKSRIVRIGEKYASSGNGEEALTRFLPVPGEASAHRRLVYAEPLTGRTHQIRVHAAESGFPILGDVLYGGTRASRVCLHAQRIIFKHPATSQELQFEAQPDFETDPRLALRNAFIEAEETDSYRVCNGASDGVPGWYVDKTGDWILSQAATALEPKQIHQVKALLSALACKGASHKILRRHVGSKQGTDISPRPLLGTVPQEPFVMRENGLRYELSFGEGYSAGIFLDQRDNRRRLLTGYAGPALSLEKRGTPPAVLNLFAYTCAFSVCAAEAGAVTTSVDLSAKYLNWGKRNFALNGLDPSAHEFFVADAFDMLRRFGKKSREFDLVLLDPPTFSQSKVSGVFRAEADYGKLVKAAAPLVRAEGILFASTNAAKWSPERFVEVVLGACKEAGRRVSLSLFFPQPLDFRISAEEPGYLKTLWVKLD